MQRLQAQINKQAKAISEAMLGTVQKVLVDGRSRRDKTELTGRTENNRIVNFVGSDRLMGQLVDIRITEVYTNSLRGEVVTTETVA